MCSSLTLQIVWCSQTWQSPNRNRADRGESNSAWYIRLCSPASAEAEFSWLRWFAGFVCVCVFLSVLGSRLGSVTRDLQGRYLDERWLNRWLRDVLAVFTHTLHVYLESALDMLRHFLLRLTDCNAAGQIGHLCAVGGLSTLDHDHLAPICCYLLGLAAREDGIVDRVVANPEPVEIAVSYAC
jgi:hypothetical protein